MVDLKWLRNNVFTLFCCAFLLFIFSQINTISSFLTGLIEPRVSVALDKRSEYFKTDEFLFVKNVESFSPLSKGDLKDIFFTIVNSGWQSFTFYCPSEYKDCGSDMRDFSQDQDLLTHINNYVHPFLSFSNVKTSLSESGEVSIQVEYLYSLEQIAAIEQKINNFIAREISDDMELYDKIKVFHDYIINRTKYDVERNENGTSDYASYLAYGPLMEGYATCNGYTDVMAIFLSKLNVPNYKIATTPSTASEDGHVWNAVYVDGEWLHLDLTWDDPVSKDGTDYLQHKYFLIDNEELKEADSGEVEVLEHKFIPSIYLEFQNR